MAGFGGAVKLTGANEYKQALQQITLSLKAVTAEMKATSSAYDIGDKSEKQMIADSKELKTSLEEQKAGIANLKGYLSDLTSKYTQSSAEHKELVAQYEKEKATLDEIGRTLGESSKEYEEQKKVVDALDAEVDKSQKSIDAQGNTINKTRAQIANAETTINQTTDAIDKMGQETKESSEGFTVMKGVLANLASQAIMSAVNGLKQLGAAFVDVGKQAVAGYGEFEQLEGGVKKIFGDDMAETVKENARNAFQTAGMSANEYMDTVTGFSASLIQSLNGDTAQATQVADRAIKDMADNANTFGTSMESIQYAYQGFAKGNFTMLDNLKLGYGGTKQEMQRLLEDASKMTDVQKELGVTIDANDMSFANIANAISVVQSNMGIMGTTAKEASMTIEGSTNSMKSAWSNMLTGLADENADFGQLATNFINTLVSEDGQGGVIGTIVPRISTVITGISQAIQTLLPQLISTVVPIIQQNIPVIMEALSGAISTILQVLPQVVGVISELIPQIGNALIGMLPQIIDAGIKIIVGLVQGITDAIPQLMEMLPTVITSIVTVLTENLPLIINAGLNLLVALTDGILQAIPQLVAQLPTVINTMINTLLGMIPDIVNAGIKLLVSLVQNLPAIINGIVQALPTLITGIVNGLMDNLPAIIDAGVQLFIALVQNLPAIINGVVSAIPQIITAIVTGIVESIPKIVDTGVQLVHGLWEGIGNAKDWILDKVRGFGQSILDGIKGFFGIHSPSKVMKDQVGAFLAEGIGEGFTDEMSAVNKQMQKEGDDTIKVLAKGMGDGAPTINKTANDLAQDIIKTFTSQKKEFAQIGQNIAQSISDGIMNTKGAIQNVVNQTIMVILQSFKNANGQFSNVGKVVMTSLANGLNVQKVVIVNVTNQVVTAMIQTINAQVGLFRTAGLQLATQLGAGFGAGKATATSSCKSVCGAMVTACKAYTSQFKSIGVNMGKGLKDGLLSQEDEIVASVSKMMDKIVKKAKEKMDINSPSRVWAEIGSYMAQGLDVGFVNEMKAVTADINGSLPTSVSGVAGATETSRFDDMVGAFKEALSEMKIEMDGEQMGAFVDKTVTRLVYT